jgi:hypothetical protein
MVSKYSVIQYEPSAISGERINIGVIAFDNQNARVNFLGQWQRVKSFAGEDVEFLKELAEEFRQLASDQLALPGTEVGPRLNEELIAEVTSAWANSVKITPPRTSLKPVNELLQQATKQFLRTPTHEEKAYRDRRSAASIAKVTIRNALEEQVGRDGVEKYYHPLREITGKFAPHEFDVVIANGSPKVAVQGVSFELPEATLLDQYVNAVAFQVFDINQAHPKLKIGILVLPPASKSHDRAKRIYQRATNTYRGLKAEVFEEGDAEGWAKREIERALQ